MKFPKWMLFLVFSGLLIFFTPPGFALESKTILFHLKTSLDHDDAQICVAYNEIWAALEEGLKVNVLIDADAVNTYKIGLFGKDDIQKYKLPERLRKTLAAEFGVSLDKIPETYGKYIAMLHKRGAKFYINGAFLVLAKIEDQIGTVENLSAKFFKPINLREMLKLRTRADYYMVY